MNNYQNKNVPDCVHNAVLDAFSKLDAPALEKEKRVYSAKKILALAVAAIMCIGLVVSVAAYGDEIWSAIAERRKVLIDDKGAVINQSVTVDGVTMSVDSVDVVRNFIGFDGDFNVSFRNENGVFKDGINYDYIKFELVLPQNDFVASYDGTLLEAGDWTTVYEWDKNAAVSDGGDGKETYLENINFGRGSKSDTINVTYSLHGKYADYRLTVRGLTSYDGSIKYADELVVDFTVDKNGTIPIQQLDFYEPDVEFEIEGCKIKLRNIDMQPTYIQFMFTNTDMDIVNVLGEDYYVLNLISKFSCNMEFFETEKAARQMEKDAEANGISRQELYTNEEYNDLTLRHLLASIPTTDEELLAQGYELVIKLNPECGAEIQMEDVGKGYGVDIYSEDFEKGFFTTWAVTLTSPIYVDDIEEVVFRKAGDPSTDVVVWIPAEDTKLPDYIDKIRYPNR